MLKFLILKDLESSSVQSKSVTDFPNGGTFGGILTNTPLFYPYQDREDMAPSFRHKLETASKIFAAQKPKSLLVFVIDAADNAVSQANSHTPPHKCFVHQLISFQDLPKNVRFVVSSRTSRLETLNIPEDMCHVPCPPFQIEETKAFLQLHGLIGSEHSVEDFHLLSRGVPRVQTNALTSAATLGEGIDFLKPNGKSLSNLFGEMINEAFDRGGIEITRSRLCCALTELSAPIPLGMSSNESPRRFKSNSKAAQIQWRILSRLDCKCH